MPVKRIFDPIAHFIELDAGETALLDLPVLQRLRRLRQVGLAYLAYPSAEHTRFSHALGALAMGERALEAIRRHSPEYFSGEADFARQRKLLRVALLLHDIGHGPFSHACEAVLGCEHESRTEAILGLARVHAAIGNAGVDPAAVLELIRGDRGAPPVLKELVSGPNLDCDRMDYLLRDSYFTGVVNGRYDVEQLIASLRIYNVDGAPALGVDGRGVVALESFVLARYMMFASVYFHHTTRMFERVLQDALRSLWPNPRALDDIQEYLAWDDFRVLDALRTATTAQARALRERTIVYGLAAEFNGEYHLTTYNACQTALKARYGAAVWGDEQEQLLHRLPLGAAASSGPTVLVNLAGGLVDAREASDVIRKLSGKAYWRKLYVKRDTASTTQARALCEAIVREESARQAQGARP